MSEGSRADVSSDDMEYGYVPSLTRRISPWFLLILGVTLLGGVLAAAAVPAQSPALATLGIFVMVLGGWVVSLCLHEYGHAITAYRGGDTRSRRRAT